MKTIKVELGTRSYDILIKTGIISSFRDHLMGFPFSEKAVLISNPTVYTLYGDQVKAQIESAGYRVKVILVPDGEEYKEFLWVYHLLGEMLRFGLDRKSCVYALGGGVVGDIAGFAASIYMRGIRCIQIPTTLLSQVDSSVGGKTGVNHPVGKNMIGTFHQPSLVIIDPLSLKTLPEREFRAGMSEVIKYGVIRDGEFFDYLQKESDKIMNLEGSVLEEVIFRCCSIKADVVSEDERESGLRAILNYGHTIGHAIETATNYTEYLHGEAVSIGMVAEAWLSALTGRILENNVLKIKDLLQSFGLPVSLRKGIKPDDIIPHLSIDKKAVGGVVRYVLPESIGKVNITSDVSDELVKRAIKMVLPDQ